MPDVLPGPRNPAFEALHPRDRSGRDKGQFVDVPGLMAGLGGEWDEPRGVWLVPAERRADLDAALADVGFDALDVPEGMRPARPEDLASTKWGQKIPPGWTDVMVSDDPEASVLVVARDAKGRRQAIYSKAHTEAAAAEKFARIRALEERMPLVDDRLSREAMGDDTAAAMMLVRKMGLRPGSNRDTKAAQQAFGATTLQRRHVQVKGDVVRLQFVGKKGVDIDLEIEDADLAKVLSRRMRGKTGTDRLFATNELKLNRWVKDTTGDDFKAKDFRTRLATAEAHRIVQEEFDPPRTAKEHRAMQLAVAGRVSALLGNNRSQALESYIDPSVFGPAPGGPDVEDTVDQTSAYDEVVSHLASFAGETSWDAAVARRREMMHGSPVEQELADMVGRWTGSGVDLAVGNDMAGVRRELEAGGFKRAFGAIRNGAPAPKLYRGIRSYDDESRDAIANMKPGDPIDLRGVSSFTEKPAHAGIFTARGTSVVIELESARGLPIAGISNTPFEAEWLVAGDNLEVAEIIERSEDGGDVKLVVKARWR